MSELDESRILVKIAQMYYEDEMNQSEISRKLGVHRTTVSRLLKQAREDGIVQIKINSDQNQFIKLERKLEVNFGLKEARVVRSSSGEKEEIIKQRLGQAGAGVLNRIIKNDITVGFAWGTTLAALANQLLDYDCKSASAIITPLVGAPGDMKNEYHVNTIVSKVATAFNAKSRQLCVPAITSAKDTKEAIIKDANIKQILELWNKLDIAVVGIGAPIKSSNMVWTGYFDNQEIECLTQKDAVGDIASRFYDINGEVIDSFLSERTIAIELEKLRDLDYSIGIASSIEKVPSILGALRGGFINVLITDEITARQILEKDNED